MLHRRSSGFNRKSSLEKIYCKLCLIQTKIKETPTLKHVKIGTRSGKLLNIIEGNLKAQLSSLSVEETEDSHPDLAPETRS